MTTPKKRNATLKETQQVILEQVKNLSDDQQVILNQIQEQQKADGGKQDDGLTAAVAQELINKAQAVSIDHIADNAVEEAKKRIVKEVGILPKKLDVTVSAEKVTHIKGIFHHEFTQLLKIVQRKVPVMLVGPAGTGKNVTLKQVADALGLEFYFTNAVTEEYKLTGFIDANGTYHETQFYKAFKNGGVFFLDEVDASIPDALIILNAAIANGYFDFPTGRVTAHPDFRVVAAANTYGLGSNTQYVGRNQLDAATLDRFVTIYFDYDNKVEQALTKNKALYNFVVASREAMEKTKMRYVVSMRATINGSRLDKCLSPQQIVKDIVFKGASNDDLATIYKKVTDYVSRSNPYVTALHELVDGKPDLILEDMKRGDPVVDKTDEEDDVQPEDETTEVGNPIVEDPEYDSDGLGWDAPEDA